MVGDSVESLPSQGRGRRRIPDQWSQVLSLDGVKEPRIKSYLVSTDLLYVSGIPATPPTRREKNWEPFFFSKTFIKDNPDISLEKFKLSNNRLKTIGVQVTKLREVIRREVERDHIHQAVEQQTSLKEVQKLGSKSKRSHTTRELVLKREMVPDLPKTVPPGSRRRSRKHNPISTHKKIQIVHKALVCKELHGSIAKEHRVSIATVSRLACKAKRKKEFYSELFAMQA